MLDHLIALLTSSSGSSSHSEKNPNPLHGLKPYWKSASDLVSHLALSSSLHCGRCSVHAPSTLCRMTPTCLPFAQNALLSNICMAFPFLLYMKQSSHPVLPPPLPCFTFLHSVYPHLIYVLTWLYWFYCLSLPRKMKTPGG